MTLAKRIAKIRNARIDSSRANIRGFMVEIDDSHVHSVYHVLMPSSKNEEAKIFVGETAYDKIDIENLTIIGCTGKIILQISFSLMESIHTNIHLQIVSCI